jgi:hypothetical protein
MFLLRKNATAAMSAMKAMNTPTVTQPIALMELQRFSELLHEN